jgi:hypothetical protein
MNLRIHCESLAQHVSLACLQDWRSKSYRVWLEFSEIAFFRYFR